MIYSIQAFSLVSENLLASFKVFLLALCTFRLYRCVQDLTIAGSGMFVFT